MSELADLLVKTAVDSAMSAPTADGGKCARRDVAAVLHVLAEDDRWTRNDAIFLIELADEIKECPDDE
ncbi:hypothetical protein [Amycolatopsis sp. GA6-003]|uniref:hypothetical protein n=1 Tax=Amycolatopsis sp. GA6-003 TaxID=2652444 RepID=UPI003916DA1A